MKTQPSEDSRLQAAVHTWNSVHGGSWFTPPSAHLICVGFIVDGVAKA